MESSGHNWNRYNNEKQIGFIYCFITFSLGLITALLNEENKSDNKNSNLLFEIYYSFLYIVSIGILIGLCCYLHKFRTSTYEHLRKGAADANNVHYSNSGESVNLYMRMGITMFGLLAVTYVGIRFSDKSNTKNAVSFQIYSITEMLFFIFQTYFIFRYHKVVFLMNKPIIGCCLLHLIITNLCTWCYITVRKISASVDQPNKIVDLPMNNTNNSYSKKEDEIASYFMPTVTEYSVLAAAIIFDLASRIGHITSIEEEKTKKKTKVVFRKYFNGLYGIIFSAIAFVITVTITICFFAIGKSDEKNSGQWHYLLYCSEEMVLHICGIVIGIVAFIKTRPLKFSVTYCKHSHDEILLFVSFFFNINYVMSIWSVIYSEFDTQDGSVQKLLVWRCIVAVLELIQITFQTYLIDDALYRCSDEKEHQKDKPGRNWLAALLGVNVSVWIIKSIQFKKADYIMILSKNNRTKASKASILNFATLPLTMLYRYHSSVCLSEIFSKIYEAEIARFESFWRADPYRDPPVKTTNSQRVNLNTGPGSGADIKKNYRRGRSSSIAVIPALKSRPRSITRRRTLRNLETAKYKVVSAELSHKLIHRRIFPFSTEEVSNQEDALEECPANGNVTHPNIENMMRTSMFVVPEQDGEDGSLSDDSKQSKTVL